MDYITDEDYARALANGISKSVLRQRVYNYNYDLERAVTEPVGSYKRVTKNMLLWEEWKEVAEKNGISKRAFYCRLNSKVANKWTAEEAATKPIGSRKNPSITQEFYDLAKTNGINISTLRNRVYSRHMNPYLAATKRTTTMIFDECLDYEGGALM